MGQVEKDVYHWKNLSSHPVIISISFFFCAYSAGNLIKYSSQESTIPSTHFKHFTKYTNTIKIMLIYAHSIYHQLHHF